MNPAFLHFFHLCIFGCFSIFYIVHVKRSRRRWFSVWECKGIIREGGESGYRSLNSGWIIVFFFSFLCFLYIYIFFLVSSHFLCDDVT
ncbi:hypothetical protein BO78DRAFT_196020 [Aspergillus sclerotiicarbonarius CBS 121057]|uniref:Uncharacterized protein n=1 Tax=Aspergillus sclerotiicarbonarius (strain CBS 121057 / IBT 28362) TaxID=1448318 RepID=A0A319E0B3_ASPSB|nr:hypothetical protein BO78DRAFT_196020 [Aspergillus sclerotiicarbonarius CBS 121057]